MITVITFLGWRWSSYVGRYLSTVNTDKGLVSLVRTPVAPPETLQQCVGYTVLAAVLFCGG